MHHSVLSEQDNVDLGELMFSLCYLPTAGRLTITVIKARNLKAMDITGASGGTFFTSSSSSHSVYYEVTVMVPWVLNQVARFNHIPATSKCCVTLDQSPNHSRLQIPICKVRVRFAPVELLYDEPC